MIDSTTMALLARLKILAKQAGTNIDLVKMSEDMEYATLLLKEISNSDNPELVLTAINLMNQFDIIKAPPFEAKAKEEKKKKERYVGALR